MAQMAAIANRSRTVNGVPTSLCDLGYCDVGLDDNWQSCGKYGPNGYSFHDANGRPVVNQQRFPDFIAMTTYAHSLGLTSGWYGNNCICSDHCSDETCYQGDVDAVMDYGFDSIKREFGGRGARRTPQSSLSRSVPACSEPRCDCGRYRGGGTMLQLQQSAPATLSSASAPCACACAVAVRASAAAAAASHAPPAPPTPPDVPSQCSRRLRPRAGPDALRLALQQHGQVHPH